MLMHRLLNLRLVDPLFLFGYNWRLRHRLVSVRLQHLRLWYDNLVVSAYLWTQIHRFLRSSLSRVSWTEPLHLMLIWQSIGCGFWNRHLLDSGALCLSSVSLFRYWASSQLLCEIVWMFFSAGAHFDWWRLPRSLCLSCGFSKWLLIIGLQHELLKQRIFVFTHFVQQSVYVLRHDLFFGRKVSRFQHFLLGFLKISAWFWRGARREKDAILSKPVGSST